MSRRWFSTATKRFRSPGLLPSFPTAANGQVVKHHVCLHNPETAAKVAEAFVPAGTKDKVIIEAFPGTIIFWTNRCVRLTIIIVGPGILTRALLELPRERIRKIIVLENAECFLDSLRVCLYIFPFVAIC